MLDTYLKLDSYNAADDNENYASAEAEMLESKNRLDSVCFRLSANARNEQLRSFIADTVREVGVTKSLLRHYNANGELERQIGMYLPSMEDLSAGYSYYGYNKDTVAEAIIGTEAARSVVEWAQSWLENILAPFRAGRRFVQSVCDRSNSYQEQIGDFMSDINKCKSLKGVKVSIPDIRKLAQCLTKVDTVKMRNKAAQYIHELNNADPFRSEDSLPNLRKRVEEIDDFGAALDKVSDSIKEIKSVEMDAAKAYADIKKIVAILYSRLSNIRDVNGKYHGFWMNGFRSQVLLKIVQGLVPPAGWVLSIHIGREVTLLATHGWRDISEACSVDTAATKLVIRALREIAKRAKV